MWRFLWIGLKRGRREMEALFTKGLWAMKPLLLKAGMALVFSLAGYLLCQLRSRNSPLAATAPPRRPPLSPPGGRNTSGGGLNEEFCLINHEGVYPHFTFGTITSSILRLPPRNITSWGELMRHEEFESSTEEEPDSPPPPTPLRVEDNEVVLQEMTQEMLAMKQEISELRSSVHSLQETERSLEIQLREHRAAKEQEEAVRELENRLDVKAVEAQLFAVKIESLQTDNARLGAQVSDYSRVAAELESARAKIRFLKRKLRCNLQWAKEKVSALRRLIAALQEKEFEENRKREEDFEQTVKRLKDLEDEAAELRMENSGLAQENLDLTKQLESIKIIEPTISENPEGTDALEETNRLRQRNEELTKEIEQLQTDRYSDVEQLVYLRWINACLRYELRNYTPAPGKTAARDLNTCLSPKSEEKAKQMILEYAYNSSNDDYSPVDFDSDSCYSLQVSSSPTSSITEAGELEDTLSSANITSINNPSPKGKLLGKLKKLIFRKDVIQSKNRVSLSDRNPNSRGHSARMGYDDDVMGRISNEIGDSCIDQIAAVDAQIGGREEARRAIKGWRCQSDLSNSGGYKRFISNEISSMGAFCQNVKDDHDLEKEELKKFADALKSSSRLERLHRSESLDLY